MKNEMEQNYLPEIQDPVTQPTGSETPSIVKSGQMSFSGRVLLGDLDDFIAPAQVCTTGLFSDNPNNVKSSRQLVMEDDFNEEFG